MKLVDRFIIQSFLKTFIFITIGFLSILYIVDFFNHISLLNKSIGYIDIIKYYLFKLPFFLHLIIPFSVLITTIAVYGNLNSTNQLTALFNARLSLYRIIAPAMLIVIAISCIYFLMNDKLVSEGTAASRYIKNEVLQSRGNLKNATFAASGNYILKTPQLDINRAVAYNPTIYEYKNGNFSEIKAKIAYLDNKTILTHANIKIYLKNKIKTIKKQTVSINENFKVSNILLHSPSSISFTTKELLGLEKTNNPKYKFLLYNKLLSLLIPIIMFILALSTVSKPFKREESSIKAVGIGMVYGGSYFLLYSIMTALGKSSLISPMIGAAAPHLVFLLFALTKIEKE